MSGISESEQLLRRIEILSALILSVVTLAAGIKFSLHAAVGVLLGGAIAILSFQILKWQLRRAFEKPGKLPRKAGLFAAYYVRYLAALFVIFVVLYYGWADPIPFLIGLSVMVLSIALVGGFEFISMVARKGDR